MEKNVMADGIRSLIGFVSTMCKSGVKSNKDYADYIRKNSEKMEESFWYQREQGMPAITSLVSASFHPTEPLILLNYTPVAHNALFRFKDGWTVPLRLCRGIVFDFTGRLVAKGFHKFFNYRENEETLTMPDGYFEATAKMDGHLGIIFEYNGKMFVTTRGSFVSNTSKVATAMLKAYAKANKWNAAYPKNVTTLVEIIHPETKVIADYGKEEKFVVIGAFDRENLIDFGYEGLCLLATKLGLPITKLWRGGNIEELVAMMRDRSVSNEEGYVVRFKDGLRVKLKFETYIAKMIGSKINHGYLMKKFLSGRLKETVELLDEEIVEASKLMLGEIMVALSVPGDAKTKWRELYKLFPEEEATSSFRGTCRSFVKSFGFEA